MKMATIISTVITALVLIIAALIQGLPSWFKLRDTQHIEQETSGAHSPNIGIVGGDVTITRSEGKK